MQPIQNPAGASGVPAYNNFNGAYGAYGQNFQPQGGYYPPPQMPYGHGANMNYGVPPNYGTQPAQGNCFPPYPPPGYSSNQQNYPQGVYGQTYPSTNITGFQQPMDENRRGGCYGDESENIPADKLLTSEVDVAIRMGFIRKVYGILSLQLLITFALATCFNVYKDAARWLYQHPWLLFVAMIVAVASVCTITCVPKVARRAPGNYILLMVIALTFGVVLGYSTGAVDSVAFSMAAGITAAVTVAVSLFACQTRIDFTGCGVFAMVGLLILMIFGITCAFWRNRVAELCYASLGAALFSFYLIMDTQKIVGGKHRKYQFSIDDYCFAALALYMDIINLFMYILELVAMARE